MRRCGSCGKWIIGKERYCPGCEADLWEEEASRKDGRPFALMEEAEDVFLKGNEEKAGVFAFAAMSRILEGEKRPAFSRMEEAVDILADFYTEAENCVTDELMSDALDYLEELAESKGKEVYRTAVQELRDRVRGIEPEAVKEGWNQILPAYQNVGWHLPLPEAVMQFSDTDSFTPDLTRTKGLSLMETGFLFYRNRTHVLSVLRRGGEKEELLDALFPPGGLSAKDAGPAAEVFASLLMGLQTAGADACRRLEDESGDASVLRLLATACTKAAGELGLFPEELFFLSLAAPYAAKGDGLNPVVYAAMEPGLKRILQIMTECRTGEGAEREEEYRRQLLQTLATEYCNLYGELEYLAADRLRAKQESYVRYLESAAGNGLSLACSETARNLFYGENGYDTDMEAAKFYTVILKMRGLLYPIVKSVEQIRDLKVRIPGIDEE